MSRTRTLAVRLPLAVAVATAGSMLLGLGGVLVCSTYPTHKDVPIDCTVEEGYTFLTIDDFSGTELGWYPVADYVPETDPDAGAPNMPDPVGPVASGSENTSIAGGQDEYVAVASVTVQMTIPEGPLCGRSMAGVFRASHNDDWGGMFGMWKFAGESTKRDASQYQGISFWARAPGNTTKGFTLLLDDDNTVAGGEILGKECRDYGVDGGVEGRPASTTTITDPGTGTPITGSSTTRAPYRDECGNGYFYVVQLTSKWHFYTIPWSWFQQNLTPNHVPNEALKADPGDLDAGTPILTSRLRKLSFRLPKEAEMELWLANLSFYRKDGQ